MVQTFLHSGHYGADISSLSLLLLSGNSPSCCEGVTQQLYNALKFQWEHILVAQLFITMPQI